MIQYFMEMPIEKQTNFALMFFWVSVVVSVVIREKIADPECRNWARIMGVFGAIVLSLQTIHATMLAEELNTQLMVKKNQKADEIARERVIAVTTQSGEKIEYGISNDGLRVRTTGSGSGTNQSSVSVRSASGGRSESAAVRLGGDGSGDATGNGLDATVELPEWWRRLWNDASDHEGTAVSFTARKGIEGKSF